MDLTRRDTLIGGLVLGLAAQGLPGCAGNPPGTTRVHVMGTIHANHRRSTRYSLGTLESAIRAAAPDVILTEIPPDRIARALSSFKETGTVDEARTRAFPEYTDVVIPLAGTLGYRILGTSGWTEEIADDRRAELAAIARDPARAAQWAEHRAAERDYVRKLAGRGDDPRFIHSDEFDDLVRDSREPYQRYFDADLGAGGWTRTNAPHTVLINTALDAIIGRGLTALITFGTAHKYMIRRSMAQRGDVVLEDTGALFA